MNLAKLLLLSFALLTSKEDKGIIFNRNENESYRTTNYILMNVFNSDPFVMDGVYAEYDKDTNGISEHWAIYEILCEEGRNHYVDSVARMLGLDVNEDRRTDFYFYDTDFNGTLDSCLTKEEQDKILKVKFSI